MSPARSVRKFAKFAGIPLAIFIVVLVVPFVNGLYYTITDWNGFKTTKFVGLSNYSESFADPRFWSTLRFTALYVIASLILVNVVAFGLALIVTSKLRSKNFLRTFFFVPNLIGGVILGVIWQFIFNSAIVALAEKYNWEPFKESWLQDTTKAFWALIIVTVWQSSGYMMIVYITGLISIEHEVVEASQIDGDVGENNHAHPDIQRCRVDLITLEIQYGVVFLKTFPYIPLDYQMLFVLLVLSC